MTNATEANPFDEEAPVEPPKRGRGRPALEVTDAQRKAALLHFAAGTSQETVAALLGISLNSVRKYLEREFREGYEIGNARLSAKLFSKAMQGDTACLIFLAKNRLGMRDRPEDGGGQAPPVRHELCLRVEYVEAQDPRAFPAPPPGRRMIEGRVTRAD